MSTELNHEMMKQLFDLEIFPLRNEEEILSFSLAEKAGAQIKLLVLLKDENDKKANAAHLELLNKIADFKGYNLSREEVIVINLAHQSVSFRQLLKTFSPPNVICFGVSPSEIELQIEARNNRCVTFMGVRMVFTLSLHQISIDEKQKKQFFSEALKPMFSSSNPF